MDYQETLNFLYNELPFFGRDGAKAIKIDLTNTLAFCEILGHPQKKFKTIHVAGTNGKGSSSHAIAAILQKGGFKTGLYTSPHLIDFRERIRVDGDVIPEEEARQFVAQHRNAIDKIHPSFFEVTVAMAFDYFANQQVDIAVIEAGLGGRLDSTNVVDPILSLITNIGFDHVDILGSTLKEIAAEKAGIIKESVPVIISEYQAEIYPIFEQIATRKKAPLYFGSTCWDVILEERLEQGQIFTVRNLQKENDVTSYGSPLLLDLQGTYQKQNLPGILTVVDELRRQGFELPEDVVRDALAHVQTLTGLQGRWQQLGDAPKIFCDTGHNVHGWVAVMENIRVTAHDALHMVLGVMSDKDLDGMLRILPQDAQYYFCQSDLPRALPATELALKAKKLGLHGAAYTTVSDALRAARDKAAADDLIFVGGSTFIVGALLADLKLRPSIHP